jgi:hypothetical protein
MKRNDIDIEKIESVICTSRMKNSEEKQRQQKYLLLVHKTLQRRKILKNAIWTGTSAMAILIIGWLFVQPGSRTTDYQSLYREFFTPSAFQTEYRGEDQIESKFSIALQAYSEQNFESALLMVDTLQKLCPQNPDCTLLVASVYQASGLLTQAESSYKIVQHFGGSYATEATWYLALLALHEGNSDSCRDYLRTIIRSGDLTHLEKAKELLKRIK